MLEPAFMSSHGRRMVRPESTPIDLAHVVPRDLADDAQLTRVLLASESTSAQYEHILHRYLVRRDDQPNWLNVGGRVSPFVSNCLANEGLALSAVGI
jgi:hypothetical protein